MLVYSVALLSFRLYTLPAVIVYHCFVLYADQRRYHSKIQLRDSIKSNSFNNVSYKSILPLSSNAMALGLLSVQVEAIMLVIIMLRRAAVINTLFQALPVVLT